MIKTESSEEFLKSVQRGDGVKDSLKSMQEVVRQVVEQAKHQNKNLIEDVEKNSNKITTIEDDKMLSINHIPKEISSSICSKSEYDDSLSDLSFYSARTSNSETFTTARSSLVHSYHMVDQECPSSMQLQHYSTIPHISFNESLDFKSHNIELTCAETSSHISKGNESMLNSEHRIDKAGDCQIDVSVSVDSVIYNLLFRHEPQYTSDDSIASLDLLLLVYKTKEELIEALKSTTGVVGYISQYWTGYFPLLLIRKEVGSNCFLSKEDIEFIQNQYSDIHHILDDHPQILDWIVRCYQHREMCNKQKMRFTEEKCSDCGLGNNFVKTEKEGEKKKRTFLDVVKRSVLK